ncbi:MAG: hypothetical protein PHN88_08880 [Ignavibacteria bacterium]|nr:hypothetical protein [Ignavibacteria bacterium]
MNKKQSLNIIREGPLLKTQLLNRKQVTSVFVFKTSVRNQSDISKLRQQLNRVIKYGKWNFDLEDCDNILRIEGTSVNTNAVIRLLNQSGFECLELED